MTVVGIGFIGFELGLEVGEIAIHEGGGGVVDLDFVGVFVDLVDELFEASLGGEGSVAAFLFEDVAVVGLGELGDTDLEVGEAGIELCDDFGFKESDRTKGTEIGVGGSEVIGSHAAPSVGAD